MIHIIITLTEMFGCRYVGISTPSKLYQGSVVLSITRSDIMSLAVSYPVQKKGGDTHHTMFNAVGTTSSVLPQDTGRPSEAERTYQEFHACKCDTTRHQKPSPMSSWEKRKGGSRF